jgi:amino acid transporter
MVAGGPYGLEELISGAGYRRAIIVLIVTPVVWSLPVALMVGELAAALPEEGGYYAWVRRAMGPSWAFQEAWLSLAASIFDMALYPTIFTLYLARLWPTAGEGMAPIAVGAAMMGVCAASNIAGSRYVGEASAAMTLILLAPFAIMAALAFARPTQPAIVAWSGEGSGGMLGAAFVALWNQMGWDNASTIAGEVERPQRVYPLTMGIAVALVTLTYLVPVMVAARTGTDPSVWQTGAWVELGRILGGHWLGWAVVAGGMVCGLGMFDALLMSYSRLPVALAQDGYLPRALARRHARSGAPWVAIVVCCLVYASCLGLGFQRLVALDVLLYGLSLILEFIALILLRIREPTLPRPFRVPGGLAGAVAVAAMPTALIAIALVRAAGTPAFAIGAALVALGPALYVLRRTRRS